MTRRFFRPLAAGAALALLATPLAFAQPMQPPGGPQYAPQGGMQHEPQGGPQPYPNHPGPMGPASEGHMQPPEAHMQHHDENWHRGSHYDGQREVVRDWHSHGLHRPPHGYEWVQSGDQFVLIAIGTGIIASVIAGALSH